MPLEATNCQGCSEAGAEGALDCPHWGLQKETQRLQGSDVGSLVLGSNWATLARGVFPPPPRPQGSQAAGRHWTLAQRVQGKRSPGFCWGQGGHCDEKLMGCGGQGLRVLAGLKKEGSGPRWDSTDINQAINQPMVHGTHLRNKC